MKKRKKHDYTSEIELNSLLIREKNRKLNLTDSTKYNKRINKYIKWYVKINHKKYPANSIMIRKKVELKTKLREIIINLSEQTRVDKISHERFGEVILLMIKHILTKPNFSGYTYVTEFYSDAISKILKYLHNFDTRMISKRSGIKVNAFAYISQIIHNSIVFIIKRKKKELENIDRQVSLEISQQKLNILDHRKLYSSTMDSPMEFKKTTEREIRVQIKTNLIDEIKKIKLKENEKVTVLYPKSYSITMDEYFSLKPLIENISIVRY